MRKFKMAPKVKWSELSDLSHHLKNIRSIVKGTVYLLGKEKPMNKTKVLTSLCSLDFKLDRFQDELNHIIEEQPDE